jgi:hypothetical protein
MKFVIAAILGLVCICAGIAIIRTQKGLLYRLVSWRYREEEAPKAIPVLDRLGGALLILTGILFLFA